MSLVRRQSSGEAGHGYSLLGPLLVGLGFGFAQFVPRGNLGAYLNLASPLAYACLGGIVVGYACRPVLTRIPWSRPTAFGVAFALLAGMGGTADWAVAWLLRSAGLASFPLHLPSDGWGLLASAGTGALLMALLFTKGGGDITLGELRQRWQLQAPRRRVGRLLLLSLGVVALWLLLAWVDARLEETGEALYVPLVEPNTWLDLSGIWSREAEPAGLAGTLLALAVLWLRSLLLVAPLLPVALTLRGRLSQVALVMALLVFVVNEFAPLMPDQPYPSGSWLLMRTGVGLLRAGLIGAAVAALFGVLRVRDAV